MIDLIKQYVRVGDKNVLVESRAAESGQIFYDVDCAEGLTNEEYETAINAISPAAEKALRSKVLFS